MVRGVVERLAGYRTLERLGELSVEVRCERESGKQIRLRLTRLFVLPRVEFRAKGRSASSEQRKHTVVITLPSLLIAKKTGLLVIK